MLRNETTTTIARKNHIGAKRAIRRLVPASENAAHKIAASHRKISARRV
jgi:hypothetical protein